jgi:uncharacterized protein YcaQ
MSVREARWLAVDAQGLGRPRPKGRIGRSHLRSVFAALGTIQLDAVNVVERTQFLVPFSRLGSYDKESLHEMSRPGGEVFEYWGHAASLLPLAKHPLFRWRMEQHGLSGGPRYEARRLAWREAHGDYLAQIFDEVRERGPLAASQLTDPRRRQGEWWGRRSVGRQALEWLFTRGELAAWRAPNFERVYDLPERVIPAEVLAQPAAPEREAHRQLLAEAARSLGVATIADLADYYRLKPGDAKIGMTELVDSGELVQLAVEGWERPAYCLAGAHPRPPRRTHATLVSPFDSLIWERDRTRRLFGFDYRIEVYVPPANRRHGYYVLPLLLADRLVARFDLKADRLTSTLRVGGAFIEPGADPAIVAPAAAAELDALRDWLGLHDMIVGERGDLTSPLRKAVR